MRMPMAVLRWVPMVLGLWEVATPYALHGHGGFHAEAALALGAVMALAGFWAAAFHDRWPYLVTAAAGLLVLVVPFAHPVGRITNDVVVGLLAIFASSVQLAQRLLRS